MPDQSRQKLSRPRDLNLLGKKIVEIATEGELDEVPSEKNPHTFARSKLGAKRAVPPKECFLPI